MKPELMGGQGHAREAGATRIMTDANTYRAFSRFKHPRIYRRLDDVTFVSMNKREVHIGKSLCPGHVSSILWFTSGTELNAYVLQVRVEGRPDEMIVIPCSHFPTWGVDIVDGWLAEDAEHFVLHEGLGFPTDRLQIFGDADDIEPIPYLESRGFQFEYNTAVRRRRWWQFWR